MSHPFFLRCLLPLLSASLLSSCPQNNPISGTSPDVLKLLYWQAPTILNPHLSTGFKDSEASRITLEPLASYNSEGELIPFLAAEIPTLENGGLSDDGFSVIWKLKPGIKWSDGKPFTAEDVVFTYEFISNPEVASTNAGLYEFIDRVEAIDDLTVEVIFRDVTPAWSLPFVGSEGLILPKHLFEDYSGANSREAPANLMAVGTGPYRVVEFKPGDIVIYEPNPFYRDVETLGFSTIELKGGGDATSAARAVLQTGEVDYADNLQVEPRVLEELEAGGKGIVLANFGPLSERIIINQTDPNEATEEGDRSSVEFPHPFLTDLQVREALDLAIDRDTIATQLYGTMGKPVANFLLLPQPYNSANTTYEFNLEKAAVLLDEAGWVDTNDNGIRDRDGVEMKIVFQTSVNPTRQKTQEIIKQSLTQLGIDVELKSIDPSILFSGEPGNTDTVARFYADLQMFTTGNASLHPETYMKTYTCDERSTRENNWSGQNFARYCNFEYDLLWDAATRELDPDLRQQLFIQMNDLLIDDVAVIPLVHRADSIGLSHQLIGIDLTPWDRNTWNISEWKKIGGSSGEDR
ncbi:peptide ABC transporter substrate-binding protein [Oscillatoriales cyanobacterium LEGE 11467]|uniref:Peptide ABC transporter substrate-binding protein n=1 Tax=Zarconia navalis LEGE 11467 TaxID=1828826 RepID=A0A928Z906_9CYAN|nr:peptide ABC transporter substrate-binding protein [Zarconia navalis LEGE 11467]